MKKCCPKNSTKPTYHERAQVIVELQFKIYLQNVKICSFFKFYSCFMHVKNWHEQKAHPRSKCTKVTQNFSTLSFSILSPAARIRKKKRKKKTGTTKCPQLYYFMEPLFFLVLAISLLFTYLAFFLMAIARGEEEVQCICGTVNGHSRCFAQWLMCPFTFVKCTL